MARSSIWKCESCGWTINTSGPHEFYRDNAGIRKPYGHPSPISEEAKKQGVKGFYIKGYCPTCDEAREAITVEFDDTVHRNWWIESLRKDVRHIEPICNVCHTKIIKEFYSKPCPKCGNIIETPDKYIIS
jgi:predicted RNA-binding Zn-ribbon protein involved in translation (DUF1610 family)